MQCTATAKSSGNQCGRDAIRGGNVCRYHGGAAPQVQMAAARRVLEALVAPALLQLRGILEDETTPAAVRLGAVRDILDRTGYGAIKQVEVLTMDAVTAEIRRLEAELGVTADELM